MTLSVGQEATYNPITEYSWGGKEKEKQADMERCPYINLKAKICGDYWSEMVYSPSLAVKFTDLSWAHLVFILPQGREGKKQSTDFPVFESPK